MMNLETEQKLIDHLYNCVNVHPYKDELIQLMDEQLLDDVSTSYQAETTGLNT